METDDRRLADEQPSFVLSNDDINKVVERLRENKAEMKRLEAEENRLKQLLYNHMNEHQELVCHETGLVILSWKYASDSIYFNEKEFLLKHKKLYEKFLAVRPGSRRLVLAK